MPGFLTLDAAMYFTNCKMHDSNWTVWTWTVLIVVYCNSLPFGNYGTKHNVKFKPRVLRTKSFSMKNSAQV